MVVTLPAIEIGLVVAAPWKSTRSDARVSSFLHHMTGNSLEDNRHSSFLVMTAPTYTTSHSRWYCRTLLKTACAPTLAARNEEEEIGCFGGKESTKVLNNDLSQELKRTYMVLAEIFRVENSKMISNPPPLRDLQHRQDFLDVMLERSQPVASKTPPIRTRVNLYVA